MGPEVEPRFQGRTGNEFTHITADTPFFFLGIWNGHLKQLVCTSPFNVGLFDGCLKIWTGAKVWICVQTKYKYRNYVRTSFDLNYSIGFGPWRMRI